jgi:hypothetical protein
MLALRQGLFGTARVWLEAALAAAREMREPSVEAATLAAVGRGAVLVAAADASALCDTPVTAARRGGRPDPGRRCAADPGPCVRAHPGV